MELLRAEIRSVAGVCYLFEHEGKEITLHRFTTGKDFAEWGNRGASIPYELKLLAVEMAESSNIEPVKIVYKDRKHPKVNMNRINKVNQKSRKEKLCL